METNNLTETQIHQLRLEALTAGDYDTVAVCDLALEGQVDADDYTMLSPKMDRRIRTMTQDEAREIVAQVISDAKARVERPRCLPHRCA